MDKIKILYVVSTLEGTGPTNQLFGKISNLDNNKFEVKVLTLSPEPENNRREDFLEANIQLDSLNLSRLRFIISGKKILERYISKNKPDIIHTTGVRADIAVSNLKTDSKHCMTIRNYALEDYPDKYGSLIGEIMAKRHIDAMKNCEYVICCSKSLKQMYSKNLSGSLFVVQNGVDINKFKSPIDTEEKMKLRGTLGLPKDKIILITVGNLIKRKDPMTIIRAFKNSNKKQDAVLLMLGEGKLMEECKKISTNNVIFKGEVKNVVEHLKASDIYVSASESEGLPNSVLEAGSSGLNIILSDIPQHREVFENELDYITLFDVGDEIALSEAIDKEITQSDSLINNEIAEFMRENFSSKSMSREYENIYQLMIKNKV